MKDNILELLKNEIICFDGAMGTEILKRGFTLGKNPELININNSQLVYDIHKSYSEAGCDVITANTFGANRLKLSKTEYSVDYVIGNAISLAKKASNNGFVALDIGPLGQMLAPLGTMFFEEAYDIFKEQVVAGVKHGADLILIETMTDLQELRIALLAAKENSNLPVFCTMSFEANGRTFMGCSIEAMATTIEGMADAIGLNCSLGPKEMKPIIKRLISHTNANIIVQANAGMPSLVNGKSVYNVDSDEFSEYALEFVKAGVNIIGGCCGTSPEYIRKIVKKVKDIKPKDKSTEKVARICSSSKVVELTQTRVIGECINPTNNEKLKNALRSNNIDSVLRLGIEQVESGAEILDVNVGLPDIDESEIMVNVIQKLQTVVDVPMLVDSINPDVIEKALRLYCGKLVVNSVNGKAKSMENILPLVKKYGASVVALTLDENGIPKTAEERFNIAQKILDKALEYGINKNNIYIDCLTLTASVQQEDVVETLKAIKMVNEKLGLKTILGVSNISYGLPNRSILNQVFLSQALACGLDLAIINPNCEKMIDIIMAHNVLHNIDIKSKSYIEKFSTINEIVERPKTEEKYNDLSDIIKKGIKNEAKKATEKLLESMDSMDIINNIILPTLDRVSEMYETEKIFLPQLIQSAETVKEAFDVIKSTLNGSDGINKGTIILAAVKGDVHDIGKNIVKIVLENYGYKIIDLGKDVCPETVLEAAMKNNVELVGLSSLMTTTVQSMEETIALLKKEYSNCKVMVGGAVLTSEFSNTIGADYYSRDAKGAIDIAKRVFMQ